MRSLVGYSRAFLGIHLLSEVLSGWFVAVLAASVVLVADRLLASRLTVRAPPNRWPVVVAAVVALIVTGVAVGADRQFHDRGPRRFPEFVAGPVHGFRGSRPVEPTRLPSPDPATVLEPLPHFTETLLGDRAQPLGLVIMADADRLQPAIRRAGWADARVVTPTRLPAELWSGLTSWTRLVGGVGAHAPLAPTFFDTAHARPRRSPTVARAPSSGNFPSLPRTDARCGPSLPRSPTPACRAGAPCCRSVASPPRSTPERDALAAALVTAGGLDDLGRFALVAPGHGSGSGGTYSTDGKVAVLRQPGC